MKETIERKEEIISRLQDKITETKGELFLLEIEKEDLEEEEKQSKYWEEESRYMMLEYQRSVI